MMPDINKLLDKYWEGETSVSEEGVLKSYFSSDAVATEHLPYLELFGWIVNQSNICSPIDVDIEVLLNKYWEGETTLKEEEVLKAYFISGQLDETHQAFAALFGYYENQKNLNYPTVPDAKIEGVKLKMVSMRRILYAAAAVLVLAIGAISVMQLMQDQSVESKSAMVHEVEDPEEALRVTKEALALVSSKFRASQESVRENIGALEKAAIFK